MKGIFDCLEILLYSISEITVLQLAQTRSAPAILTEVVRSFPQSL
jgi:hypothetical protein